VGRVASRLLYLHEKWEQFVAHIDIWIQSLMPTTSYDVFAFRALLQEVVCSRRLVDPKASPGKLMFVVWVTG
jgi:hypothetical protein